MDLPKQNLLNYAETRDNELKKIWKLSPNIYKMTIEAVKIIYDDDQHPKQKIRLMKEKNQIAK